MVLCLSRVRLESLKVGIVFLLLLEHNLIHTTRATIILVLVYSKLVFLAISFDFYG